MTREEKGARMSWYIVLVPVTLLGWFGLVAGMGWSEETAAAGWMALMLSLPAAFVWVEW